MARLVFLLEERSMKVFLEELLPRLFPTLSFLCVTHEGKQDLEKSIPRKLRAWREPGVRFIVIRDNDGADCRRVKEKLVALCQRGGRPDSVVRIACQELEAWYLGDPLALAEAYERPDLPGLLGRERFRDPDQVQQPSTALRELVPEFQKVTGARRMGALVTELRNRSCSFHALLDAIHGLVATMLGNGEASTHSGANA